MLFSVPVVFDADMIHCSKESPTFMGRNYCKGTFLRAIMLTHDLDDHMCCTAHKKMSFRRFFAQIYDEKLLYL